MEHWLRSHRSAPGKDPAGVDAAERRLALVRGQEAERGPEVGDRLRPGSRCEGHAPPQRTAVLAVGERAPLQNVSDCLARGACMSVAVYTAVAVAVAAAVAVAVTVAVAVAVAVAVLSTVGNHDPPQRVGRGVRAYVRPSVRWTA